MRDEGSGMQYSCKYIQYPEMCCHLLFFISYPSSFIRCPVLVEQPGVLACLSRRRSRVQIPPGTLGIRHTPCAVVREIPRRGTQIGKAAKLNLRVCGFDSRLHTRSIASAGHRRAQLPVKQPPSGCVGSTPARRTDNTARKRKGTEEVVGKAFSIFSDFFRHFREHRPRNAVELPATLSLARGQVASERLFDDNAR